MDKDSAGQGREAAPSAVDALGAVMDDEGHFHVTDAPIDLSRYRLEDWIAMAFFWLLAAVVAFIPAAAAELARMYGRGRLAWVA